MEKIKIWGKEIPTCVQCHYNWSDEYNTSFCTYTGKLDFEIGNCDEINSIHENCPFAKSVSDIISDNFIFVHIGGKLNKDAQQIYKVSSKKLGDVEVLYTEYSKKCIIRHPNYTRNGSGNFQNYEVLFNGIINNPVELEFILKSIGVIE